MCGAVTERIAESLTRVTLTTRQTEVLELLQSGMCNKTIARDLGIAPGTVKAHVKGILEKLESTTRTQAVAVATHRGLIKASLDQPGLSAWRSGRGGLVSNYPASERLHLQFAA
jgi:DNA-binding CsgD family transcriptional regulator